MEQKSATSLLSLSSVTWQDAGTRSEGAGDGLEMDTEGWGGEQVMPLALIRAPSAAGVTHSGRGWDPSSNDGLSLTAHFCPPTRASLTSGRGSSPDPQERPQSHQSLPPGPLTHLGQESAGVPLQLLDEHTVLRDLAHHLAVWRGGEMRGG